MKRVMALLSLSLLTIAGCNFSFGGDVHVSPRQTRRVLMTTFGGDVEVPNAPRGATVQTFGGDVRMGEVGGDAYVTSFGGAIVIDRLEDDAMLTSFGGDVAVTVENSADEGSRDLEIRSFGGDVTLRVPSDYSSRIVVRQRLRRLRPPRPIESDFEMTVSKDFVRRGFDPRRVRLSTATIGDGRNLISVRAEGSRVRIVRI